MKIIATIGSEAVGTPKSPAAVANEAALAERAGFSEAWCVHFSRGIDALTTLASAATQTTQIDLGVGVIPTYPRHPVALAQSAATVQSLSSGRFTLGVGVSHRPVIEGMHGLDYGQPLSHLREYLTVLTSLLRTGEASFSGAHFRVEASITVPDTTRVPVVVGALAPRMSRLAGELTDGVTTWLAGPRSLAEVVVPAVRRGAADSDGGARRVVAAIPVALDEDIDRARSVADAVFGRYGGLPNYARLFEREGVASPSELAIVGGEGTITRRFVDLLDAGATDVWAVPFDTGTGLAATVDLLSELAVN